VWKPVLEGMMFETNGGNDGISCERAATGP
jgi:hypothetical protein